MLPQESCTDFRGPAVLLEAERPFSFHLFENSMPHEMKNLPMPIDHAVAQLAEIRVIHHLNLNALLSLKRGPDLFELGLEIEDGLIAGGGSYDQDSQRFRTLLDWRRAWEREIAQDWSAASARQKVARGLCQKLPWEAREARQIWLIRIAT
ncbi:MAG TPA: hypothetical protein VMM92_06230 [Thermoanaerobaculia bacterium]|nr:hypothetical protein [Thermoanaerobaculia bacterium]